MYRGKKKRIIILVALIILLGILTVGYAAFESKIKVKGNAKVTSNWDIRITNIVEAKKTGSAESAVSPTWTHLTAYMEADLYEKGDSVEYEVTIENKGTLDAKLDNIISNIKSNNEATTGLESFQMPKNNVILYAIYKKQLPPIIDNVSTSITTNSITAVVSAHDEETDIIKYEFSINDGEYIDVGNNNVYTFNNLTSNTPYKIKVRVTNKYNLNQIWQSGEIKTQILQIPTFKEEFSGAVTINYPQGCGSKYTCSYIKDNETEVVVDGNTTVYFRQSGNVLAKVTDGTNSVSSTYTISNLVTVANKYTTTEKTFGVFNSSDPSMELEAGGNTIVCNTYEECYGTTGTFEYDADGALILNDKNSIGVIGILDLSQSFTNLQSSYSLAMTLKAPTKQGTTNLNNNYPTTLFAITDNIYHMLWVGFYQDYLHVYCYHTGSSVSNTAKDQTSEGFTSIYIGNYNEKTFNLQITAAINGKSRIYINGNMVREFNSGSGVAPSTKAYLGDLRLGRKLKFTGKIYDMTFYDKVMSSDEINQNWLNSKKQYNIN